MIRAEDIWHSYGRGYVLKGINLEVRDEVLSIIGPVGVGKTTLLKILSLLIKPKRGKVYIGGESSMDIRLRRKIGFSHQNPFLFDATVYENVALPLKVRGEYDKKRVEECLHDFSLWEIKDKRARELSGGEVKRVSLARAFVQRPEILVLDEPMTNLDPEGVKILERKIREFRGPVIMATHELYKARGLSDRLLFLHDGVIYEEGKPEDLLDSPKGIRTALFSGMNIIEGEVRGKEEGINVVDVGGERIYVASERGLSGKVALGIRPEDVVITKGEKKSTRNTMRGKIKNIVRRGPVSEVEIEGAFPLKALITTKSLEEMGLREGEEISVLIKATAIKIFEDEIQAQGKLKDKI